jgi:hypothetical protein
MEERRLHRHEGIRHLRESNSRPHVAPQCSHTGNYQGELSNPPDCSIQSGGLLYSTNSLGK